MLVVMPLQLLLEIILASGYANFFLLKFPLIGWKAVQTLYYIDTPPYYSWISHLDGGRLMLFIQQALVCCTVSPMYTYLVLALVQAVRCLLDWASTPM